MPPITDQRPAATAGAAVSVTPRVHRVEKPKEDLDTLATAIEESLTPAAAVEQFPNHDEERQDDVDEEDDEDDEDGVDGEEVNLIEVDRTRCLSCGHLVAWADKFFDRCHYSKGNENCTASVFRIKLAVPIERLGRSLAESEFNADAESSQRTMNKIVEQQRKGNLSAEDYQKIIEIRDETLEHLRRDVPVSDE